MSARLLLCWGVLDRNRTGPNQLPKEVKADVYVLRPCGAKGFAASLVAPSLSTNTLMLFSEREGTMNDDTAFTNSPSLTPSPSATYSASVVESVTIFCVLLEHLTVELPTVTTTPDTDLLSSAFSA